MAQVTKEFKTAMAVVSFEDKNKSKSRYGLDDTNEIGLRVSTSEEYPDTMFSISIDEWEEFKAFVDKAIADNKDG